MNVVRNKAQPELKNLPATVKLSMNHPEKGEVLVVQAEDDDTRSPFGDLTYSIVGDDSADIYFTIDQYGNITIRRSLSESDGHDVEFNVSRFVNTLTAKLFY